MSCRGRYLCAAAGSVAVTLIGLAVAAQGPIACFSPDNGPCVAPEPFGLFLPPGSEQVVLITNFGLLSAPVAGGAMDLVCDDQFGRASWQRIRFDPAGRTFAASESGLYSSSDGCAWAVAAGDMAGQPVRDVTFAARTPGRAWALAGSPPALYGSSDGGRSFQLIKTFDPGMTFARVIAAPGGEAPLYLTGHGEAAVSLVATSLDGGQTWATRDIAGGITPEPSNPLELLAVAPDDPRVMFFSVTDPFGDQIWRTADGGATVARVLTFGNAEVLSGFTFGATGQNVYVAARDLFAGPDDPPARLHVSRDGGASWGAPIVSPAGGATYRCLGFRAGKLYACGGGEPFGEPFLLGVSADEGASWAPVGQLSQLIGGRSCVRAQCTATEEWLCVSFGACAPDVRVADAGVADARGDACGGPNCEQTGASTGGWCSVEPAARGGPSSSALAALALVLFRLARRRRWRALYITFTSPVPKTPRLPGAHPEVPWSVVPLPPRPSCSPSSRPAVPDR
jgi:photosystem II stability/assembly factor-like uncharacterized protein